MSIKNLRILMDGPEVTSNRRLNLFSIIIPLLGAVFALFSIPFLAITNTIVMIFIVFFLLNAIGVGTGLHRFFCHHAFATSTPVHYILAILGTAACQGPIDRGLLTTEGTIASRTSLEILIHLYLEEQKNLNVGQVFFMHT